MNEHPENNPQAGIPPIEEIRSRLKAMGYLESPVERFLSRPAGGLWATGLLVTVKASVLAGFLLSGLTTASALLADPAFILNLLDVLLFICYLWAAYSAGAFILLLVPALLWVRKKSRDESRGHAGTLRSAALSTLTASVLCIYLLSWWHVMISQSQQILPFGVVSLAVLLSIGMISLAAGRLIGLVYFLLAGVPEASQKRKKLLARGYFVSLIAVVVLESAWGIGAFRLRSADTSLKAALRDYTVRPLPVLLVGVDGIDSQMLKSLAEKQALPNLTRLIEGGYAAELKTEPDFLAPQVWTTIATGVKPELHGINHFTLPVLRGMSRQPRLSGARTELASLALEHVFPFLKLVRSVPLSASSRMTRTIWEIFELFSAPAGVVNWWASWPVSSTNGFIVSERTFLKLILIHSDEPIKPSTYYDREVFPAAEFDSLVNLRRRIEEDFEVMLPNFPQIDDLLDSDLPQSLVDLVRSVYFADYFYTRAALDLARRYKVNFLALYLQGPDVLSRLDERSELVHSDSLESLIPEYCRFIDSLLGELLQKYQPTGLAVAVFEPGKKGRQRDLSGEVIFSGLDVKKGAVSDQAIRLEDITPSILYLVGLPVARNMVGRAVTEAGLQGPGGAVHLNYVTSYGLPSLDWETSPNYRHDNEMIERLRSLGYLK